MLHVSNSRQHENVTLLPPLLRTSAQASQSIPSESEKRTGMQRTCKGLVG